MGPGLLQADAYYQLLPQTGWRPRTLLLTTYNELRGQGYSFLTIVLDLRDPLSSALSGLFSQPTDIWACMATSDGTFTGSDLTSRPMHHEIALV